MRRLGPRVWPSVRPKMSVWGHAGARSAPAKVACNPTIRTPSRGRQLAITARRVTADPFETEGTESHCARRISHRRSSHFNQELCCGCVCVPDWDSNRISVFPHRQQTADGQRFVAGLFLLRLRFTAYAVVSLPVAVRAYRLPSTSITSYRQSAVLNAHDGALTQGGARARARRSRSFLPRPSQSQGCCGSEPLGVVRSPCGRTDCPLQRARV